MTGLFIRTKLGENVEIEFLTPEQFQELAESNPDAGWRFCEALAKWIRENVSSLNTKPGIN